MATNTNFSHCQECGKKLTSAVFCLACRSSFCSQTCYQSHKAKHAGPSLEKQPAEGKARPPKGP
jgi:hypothetical protein